MSPVPKGGKLLRWAKQVHTLRDVSRQVTLRRLRIGLNLAVLVLASVLKRQTMCETHVLELSVLPENAGQKFRRGSRYVDLSTYGECRLNFRALEGSAGSNSVGALLHLTVAASQATA
jgi:hypothetical protein